MRILVFLFYGFLIVKFFGFLYKIFLMLRQMNGKSNGSSGKGAGLEMVHDKVCDRFLLKSEAKIKVIRGVSHYFCSDECYHKYQATR